LKQVIFIGSSLDDLRDFPDGARRNAGYQLERVQKGLDPDDWKQMQVIGQGVREIRVRNTSGAFRVIYVVAFMNAVYVLHAFQKKTQKTSKRDLKLGAERFKQVMWRIRQ